MIEENKRVLARNQLDSFLKAMKDREERFLLEVAVDGFAAKFDAVGHYSDEVNEEIRM